MKNSIIYFLYLLTIFGDLDQNSDRIVSINASLVMAKNKNVEIIYGKDENRYYKIVYDKKKAGIDKNYIFQVGEQYELSLFRFDTIRPQEWLHESAWLNECLVLENTLIRPDDTINGLYILNWMKKKE